MANNSSDFQSIYREHAYEVYRDAFEELRDAEQTRECVYQVFSRIRAEGLTDPAEIRARIPEYRAAYVAQIKTARLDVDQVWYRIRNDELTEHSVQADSMPSFRERLRDEARRTREAAARQAELTGHAEPEEEPGQTVAAVSAAVSEPAAAEEPIEADEHVIHADPGIELTPVSEEEPAADEFPEEAADEFPDEFSEETAEELPIEAVEEPVEEIGEEQIGEIVPEDNVPQYTVSEETLPEEVTAAEIVPEVPEEPERRRGSKVYWVIFVIVLVIFLWVLADILMYKGILPGVNLGYAWFNEHLFPLFPYA